MCIRNFPSLYVKQSIIRFVEHHTVYLTYHDEPSAGVFLSSQLLRHLNYTEADNTLRQIIPKEEIFTTSILPIDKHLSMHYVLDFKAWMTQRSDTLQIGSVGEVGQVSFNTLHTLSATPLVLLSRG